MRRWLHERLGLHRWDVISHRHDVEQGGEKFGYELGQCRCGVIREVVIVRHAVPSPFPGMEVLALEATVTDLDRLEDAKVWAES